MTAKVAMPAPVCPQCGAVCQMQATVEEFGNPEAWLFWGKAGARWIKCRMPHCVHFTVRLDGGALQHRIAYTTKETM